MNSIFICAILAIVGGQPSSDGASGPSSPVVLKVDPPTWWPGHSLNPVRLLVRGRNLQGAKLGSSRHDVVPSEIRINERGTYLFVSLAIDPRAPAGNASLELETKAGTATVPFRLDLPVDSKTFRGGQGITQDDVIYLIMPDRFSDGDVVNNTPADSPREANGRSIPRGWHGGDLRGIINHLDYFQELGITALWLTPWFDNFNGMYECNKPWCPYTYYHGYHAVDLYAVEDHFGSLETLRELVTKAHARGLKVIQDQVSNQVGLRHPWVNEPPLPTWFHGTALHHKPNSFQNQLLSSPHTAAPDRAPILDGWFSDDSPDLNQDEAEVARYLIQNSLWWVGTAEIDGIREDTTQYLPRAYLRNLSGALHRQHPRLTIVGEVLDIDPVHTSFFLGGTKGWDGIDTGFDSVFDFPTWFTSVNVFSGKAPMTDLRKVLRADSIYADPARLTTLTSNHDVRRFISWPGATHDRARLQVAFTLTIRGTPQLYYGDEIALPGNDDPDNRRDFPGGFPGDKRSVFQASGRTAEEQRMWTWTRDWLTFRRSHSALRRGTLVDLFADPNVYIYARRDSTETIVIALNRGAEPASVPLSAAAIDAQPGKQLVPIMGGGQAASVNEDRVSIRLAPVSAVAYVLK